MSSWKARDKSLRLFGRRVLLLGLFVLFVASSIGVWRAYEKMAESAELRRQAEGQLADLQQRADKLDHDIAGLETDRGMEEKLREQYALAAKGEGLIVIVDQDAPPPVHATSTLQNIIHHIFPWW